jgi:hypothetical protein
MVAVSRSAGENDRMKMPDLYKAVIASEKIVRYLLDVDHPYGGSKARLLLSLGYSPAHWQQLEMDLRTAHLTEYVVETKQTNWGVRYEIVAPLTGPSGDTVVFRSVWQIDLGTDVPRLITMYPE